MIGTYAVVISANGTTIMNTPVQETGDGTNNREVSLAAGESGTLSTRSDDGAGVLTVTGHSIEAADVVDIYWPGGERYGVTVDSVDTNTITFDDTPAATGDVLPVQDTAIVVCERQLINIAFDGDDVQLFAIHTTQRSQCSFYDADDDLIKQYELAEANVAESWYASSSESNPLTGDAITYAYASNGSATAATLTILCLVDSTP